MSSSRSAVEGFCETERGKRHVGYFTVLLLLTGKLRVESCSTQAYIPVHLPSPARKLPREVAISIPFIQSLLTFSSDENDVEKRTCPQIQK